jgi:hypothetical protein
MGLDCLSCPRCSQWDDDGEYPTLHGARAIEVDNKKDGVKVEWFDICDKCFAELEAKGGRVFYLKEVVKYVKVYGKDPHVEYGSVKKMQCPTCYQYYLPSDTIDGGCPFRKYAAPHLKKVAA